MDLDAKPNPGDLSVRIGFARVFGGGPDNGKLRPSLEITDGTSRLSLRINLLPENIAELMAGSAVEVKADAVQGFAGLRNFGKYHKHMSLTVRGRPDDYKKDVDPRTLPHVAEAIASIEAAGYRAGSPRRNNAGAWVIIGRMYEEKQ